MFIRATPTQLATDPNLMQLAVFFTVSGGRIDRDPADGLCSYYLDDVGEMMVQPEQLALCYAGAAQVDKATLFVEMTAEEYAAAVPSKFPSATITDEKEQEVARTWDEYAPFATRSPDGKSVLVQCVRVEPGATCGNGLSADEFRLWFAEFGPLLLTKAQAMALLASEKYVAEEPQ